LRNPLSVMVGYLDFFLDGLFGKLSDRQAEAVHVMKHSCENMLALINDLLDVSIIESGQLHLEKRETDVGAFLKDCYAQNNILAQAKSIKLELDLEPQLPPMTVDPHRMAQALNNLLSNAVKFSASETVITLKAWTGTGFLHISVEDQGQGIPESEHAKLFTGFGRTSIRPTAGESSTGLGLAITKNVIEAHGGKILVHSKPGVGSKFILTIPLERH
jgi:two-component system, sensor histidine kinase and response regulator